MTTYQQGHAPDGAPMTWEQSSAALRLTKIQWKSGAWSFHEKDDAESIFRAFHLAKLAEDYAKAKAAMDAAATAADIESVRAAYYDAARALCEAVR